jgi:hypothetical protein
MWGGNGVRGGAVREWRKASENGGGAVNTATAMGETPRDVSAQQSPPHSAGNEACVRDIVLTKGRRAAGVLFPGLHARSWCGEISVFELVGVLAGFV